MVDLLVMERGGGGDLVKRGDDIATTEGIETAVYLSHFGGSDWWGNELIEDRSQRFSAITEALLTQTVLTSAGRIKIEQALLKDLDWVRQIPDAEVAANVFIAAPDRVEIRINLNGRQFIYLWNPGAELLTYIV